MTRLSPAPQEKLEESRELLDIAASMMGFEANSLKMMAHRPAILAGFMGFMAPILGPDARLDGGLRQLIANIASAAAGCRYCQAHTAHSAHERGSAQKKLSTFGLMRPVRFSMIASGPLWPWRRLRAAFPMPPQMRILKRRGRILTMRN